MSGRRIDIAVEGQIAVLTIRRPEKLNAFDLDMLRALAEACDTVEVNAAVRAVVLTGEGKAFSAGGDVKAMKAREGAFGGGGVELRDGYRNNIHRIVRSI